MTEEAATTEIPVGEDVRGYIDAIPAAYRPLFDRLHGLIVRARPDVTVVMYPKLKTSTGTIQLRPDDAAAISDDEFLGLFRGALAG